MGNFECKFQTEGASPTNNCWCQKTRVIVLLSGIKISAVHYLDLSQRMSVTDGRTEFDSQDRASIAAGAVKTTEKELM